MILIHRDNLGGLPLMIVCAAMTSAIVIAVMASLSIVRSPVLFVPGAKSYLQSVKPGDPDVTYVLSFASTYFEKYAIWNKYTFLSNRQWVLHLSDKTLGNTIATETKNTGYMVELLQKSQQARVAGKWYTRVGRRWYIQIDYERRQYDGSVARLKAPYRAILVITPVLPTTEYPFGCEVTALIDGTTDEVQPLQDSTPVLLQDVAPVLEAPSDQKAPVQVGTPAAEAQREQTGSPDAQVTPEVPASPDTTQVPASLAKPVEPNPDTSRKASGQH